MATIHELRATGFVLAWCLAGCSGSTVVHAPIADAGLHPDAGIEPDATAGGHDAGADADSLTPDGAPDAPPPWTPDAIRSSLAFWFDPTSLVSVGGLVTRWADRSGNGNDALQATAAYEPAYNPAGIGGLPSATFTGPITSCSPSCGRRRRRPRRP